MRIILSRKGFDSACGGVASPILPDGQPQSLPIPHAKSDLAYDAIRFGTGSLGPMVEALTRGRITRQTAAHLDPDIDARLLPRPDGWRPLFGQTDAAATHLSNQGVGPGDLFLFFGWFRQTEHRHGVLRYVRGAPDLHLFYGWMQVAEVWPVGERIGAGPEWARYHPHLQGGYGPSNGVYMAPETLRWPGISEGMPGAGVFPRATEPLILTAPGRSRSVWQLPAYFHPEGRASALSYHADPRRWTRRGDGLLLRSAAQGQEFVLNTRDYPEAIPWAACLLADATRETSG